MRSFDWEMLLRGLMLVPRTSIPSVPWLRRSRESSSELGGRRKIEWVESNGQIEFYDEPSLIAVAADLVAEFFREALASKLRDVESIRVS